MRLRTFPTALAAAAVVVAFVAARPVAAKTSPAPAKSARPGAEVAATDADVMLRTHAGLLRAEDERNATDPAIVAALSHPVATLRLRAVRALGRIGDPVSVPLVSRSLVDADPEVRREAAFALGEIESPAALSALTRVLASDDPELRALTCEALAKIAWKGSERAQVGTLIVTRVLAPGSEKDPAVVARALQCAWRFGAETPGLVSAVGKSFLRAEPAVSEAAAYAAARLGDSRLGSMLELATRDDRASVRAIGCRGLGRLAHGKEPEKERSLERRAMLIRRALDVDKSVRLAALGALDTFPPAEPVITQEFLDVTLRSNDPGLQRTALTLVGAWHLMQEAPTVMRIVAQGPDDLFPEAATALVRLQGKDAIPALQKAAEGAPWNRRAAVAEALAAEDLAGSREAAALQDILLADKDARVVASALDAAVSCGRHDASLLALAHLGAKDEVVRAIAAASLPKLVDDHVSKDEAAEALRRAWRESQNDASNDVRVTTLEALVDLLGEGARPELTAASAMRDWGVRLKAHQLFKKLGGDVPLLGTASLARPLSFYIEMARAEDSAQQVLRLETDRGVIDVALARSQAPLTVFQMTELARKGYFDGLTFHRVVPDFVAQGGCPRGDGWGGPDLQLRCEINRLPFDRGAAGMALSGKDTGGSQFFFTLQPQPHLDGGYTVFGHVTADTMPVVDKIRRFDVIRHATVIAGPVAPAVAASR